MEWTNTYMEWTNTYMEWTNTYMEWTNTYMETKMVLDAEGCVTHWGDLHRLRLRWCTPHRHAKNSFTH